MIRRVGIFQGIEIVPTVEQPAVLIGQSQASSHSREFTKFVNKWVPCSCTVHQELEELYPRLCEGGYVIDNRFLDWEVACEIISGPMDDIELAPLQVRSFMMRTSFNSLEEFFLYEKKRSEGGGNLSTHFVSMDLYAEWWAKRGAKVGRKIKGEIVFSRKDG